MNLKIIDRYLWTATLQGIVIAWLALVLLDVFFAFISEAEKTNALYTTLQATVYLIYTLPSRFYEFFPNAALVGTLLGLGNLAANSEFVAMRAAGLSIGRIIFSVVKLGLLLAAFLFVIGEWVVPNTDLQARNFKAQLKNKNIVLVGGAGLWVKEKNSIISIGSVITNKQVSDISIYSFKADHSGLESLTEVEYATASETGWDFKKVTTTVFEKIGVKRNRDPSASSINFVDPNILETATVDPNQLSSSSLTKFIEYQRRNDIKTDKYELIYWKRFSVPLSAIVMLILAMPFLFGSNRGGGAGQRVFIGIIVGILFYLANRSVNELGIVYGFSPIVSAFVPSLLFLAIGIIALRRVR
ncbi:MAG: lipopolysaccharide export system permease protein [Cocleimonas sp.]|jgi:lipopolysaccharide export system permease protein